MILSHTTRGSTFENRSSSRFTLARRWMLTLARARWIFTLWRCMFLVSCSSSMFCSFLFISRRFSSPDLTRSRKTEPRPPRSTWAAPWPPAAPPDTSDRWNRKKINVFFLTIKWWLDLLQIIKLNNYFFNYFFNFTPFIFNWTIGELNYGKSCNHNSTLFSTKKKNKILQKLTQLNTLSRILGWLLINTIKILYWYKKDICNLFIYDMK